MSDFFSGSVYFGVMLSIIAYAAGLFLKKKLRHAVFNPLLISVAIVMLVLLIFNVDYDTYYEGAKYLSYLLTPATVCLAIPLYQQWQVLKSNIKTIVVSVAAGVLASLLSILLLSLLFGFTQGQYVTLLPKSITTAIGIGLAEEVGGSVNITVAAIIVTGITGNVVAEGIVKLFKIKDPIAKGLAIGTSAHAIGTTKAIEIGEIEGAMSSLAIVVAGLMTVVGASFFAMIPVG